MTPAPPRDLIEHLREGRCLLFAGAGLSAWAGLPPWHRLLELLIERVRDNAPADSAHEELGRLLKAGRYLDVAEICRDMLGPGRFADFMQDTLRVPAEVPEPHQIIVRLPFAGLVTTNYDRLLENAFAQGTGSQPQSPTHDDEEALGRLLFRGVQFIFKAHGDLTRPDTLVLTQSDYRKLIHANDAFDAFFSTVLMTRAVLFVGYSLSDPDFGLLMDRHLTIFNGYVPDRYALMAGVSNVERAILKKNANINVIPYPADEHHCVLEFLEALESELGKRPAGLNRRPGSTRPSRATTAFASAPAPASAPDDTRKLIIRRVDGDMTYSTRGFGERHRASLPLPVWQAAVADAAAAYDRARSLTKPKDRIIRSDDLVPGPIAECLSKTTPGELLVLELDTDSETVPWEWMKVGNEMLMQRCPLVRSRADLSESARGYPAARRPERVLVIGDPSEDLHYAREEALQVGEVYKDATTCQVLLGKDATYEAVADALAATDFDLVHFAGRAGIDRGRGIIQLAGNVIVDADQFTTLLGMNPPALFMISEIVIDVFRRSLQAPLDANGGPPVPFLTGGRGTFPDAAASIGIGAFIGCLNHPTDEGALRVALGFHRELLAGHSAAHVLYRARQRAAIEAPDDATPWYFTLSGHPEFAWAEEAATASDAATDT